MRWLFTSPITKPRHAELHDALIRAGHEVIVDGDTHKPVNDIITQAARHQPDIVYLGTLFDRSCYTYSKHLLAAANRHGSTHPTHPFVLIGDQYGPQLQPSQQTPKGCEAGYNQCHGVIYFDRQAAIRAVAHNRRRAALWHLDTPAPLHPIVAMATYIYAHRQTPKSSNNTPPLWE